MAYTEQYFAVTDIQVDPSSAETQTHGPFESYGDAVEAGEISEATSFVIEKRFVLETEDAD